jgi:serine/threonine-protein kinase
MACPPTARDPQPIRIPETLDEDEVYIPAGWTLSGGDQDSCDSWLPRRRLWVDGVIIKRTPVTNRQYLEFVNDLESKGKTKEVQKVLPRFEMLTPYLQDRDKVWGLRTDMFMFNALPDDPVVMVDWHSAAAYADWLARKTGQPWRLPDELTWEKAGRGVDGRIYPWGNRLDPTWCNMRESQAGRPRMVPAGSFDADSSPYGVRDMGGNSMDWCRDAFRTTGPPVIRDTVVVRDDPGQPRSIRGGHFYAVGQISRVCHRYRLDPSFRAYMLGFRVARAWS